MATKATGTGRSPGCAGPATRQSPPGTIRTTTFKLAVLLIDRGDQHRDVADVEAGLGYAERGQGEDLPSFVSYVSA